MICLILSSVAFAALSYVFFKIDANPILAFFDRFFPNKKSLSGKTIWVVGASTGIGEELAYQLAELNCRLILTATTEGRLQEVKQNCLKKSTNLKEDDILVLAYDISDFEQNDIALKKILDQYGDIDVLISNAGKFAVSRASADDFKIVQKIFDINFFGHVYITKLLLRHWLDVKAKNQLKKINKQIVATSSILSYVEIAHGYAYSSTKKALNTFMRDTAMQHQKDGIYVTLAMPGETESKIFENMLGQKNANQRRGGSRKMDASRCASLMIVAMSNKLNEVWICMQPVLILTYLFQFFSYYFVFMVRHFGRFCGPLEKGLLAD